MFGGASVFKSLAEHIFMIFDDLGLCFGFQTDTLDVVWKVIFRGELISDFDEFGEKGLYVNWLPGDRFEAT